jgi:hypothetical protein
MYIEFHTTKGTAREAVLNSKIINRGKEFSPPFQEKTGPLQQRSLDGQGYELDHTERAVQDPDVPFR